MYSCGKVGCECTHQQGCEFGWIHGVETERKVTRTKDGETVVKFDEYQVVSPCPNCQPEKYQIFATARSRQELQENLRKRSTHNRLKTYEESEEGRTRTL